MSLKRSLFKLTKHNFSTNKSSSNLWSSYLSSQPKEDPIHKLLKNKSFINNEWIDSSKKFDLIDPGSFEHIISLPDLTETDTKNAIDIAYKSLKPWQKLTIHERCEIVNRISTLMLLYKEQLSRIISIECGKPLNEARGEVAYSASFFKWFAEEGRRLNGDILPGNLSHRRMLVTKEPVGVCGIITPWNFPSAMIARKLAPALVVGCTSVIKPPELTPLSALALAEIAQEAGVLPGVINIITTKTNRDSIGKEICKNKLVRKLSFTGSTKAGILLNEMCASTLKRVSLELGGHAPFIVFNDANIDDAVNGAIASKYRNAGQTCVCTNRYYIHKNVKNEFCEKFAKKVKEIKVGHGFDNNTIQGPLISQSGLDKVKDHMSDALKNGSEILTGGNIANVDGYNGYYFEPTVITNVNEKSKIYNEETFGPIAAIFEFENDDDVIEKANNTDMGLASYFYTNNLNRAFKVSESLQYGMVGVNSGLISSEIGPFGGVKFSGFGREGSIYGINEYINLKYTCIDNIN